MPKPLRLTDWLELLERRHPLAIELGLERVSQVAARLDLARPAPRVITVAGTNGKGSCVAMLEALLQSQGVRVGCYTSPHLLRYNERIRIDGQAVSDAALCAAFARIEAARDTIRLTYFEVGTLAALLLMREAEVSVAVLEVGMGGRLDAVNIVDPDVAIITSIDLDHQAWLGADRDSIGLEKAGIARPGIPTICGDPNPPRALLQYLRALPSPTLVLGEADFCLQEGSAGLGLDLACRTADGEARYYQELPEPQLPATSAACAVQGLLSLGIQPTPTQIATAFERTRLAGRFHCALYRERAWVLDVAHNPAAAALLAGRLAATPGTVRHAVFGALADKDLAGILTPLIPQIAHWYCCDLPGVPRAAPSARLTEVLYNAGCGDRVAGRYENPLAAAAAALRASRPGERIVVFGSFHTVAPVLGLIADDAERAGGDN